MVGRGYFKWVTVEDGNKQEHELGFDEEGLLYWDERRVMTEQKLAIPAVKARKNTEKREKNEKNQQKFL